MILISCLSGGEPKRKEKHEKVAMLNRSDMAGRNDKAEYFQAHTKTEFRNISYLIWYSSNPRDIVATVLLSAVKACNTPSLEV